MIKVLVVEATQFGYDGITSVIKNYFSYIDHKNIQMDFVTINPVSVDFKFQMDQKGSINYVISCRNHNPVKYIATLSKIAKRGQYDIIHVHGCSATMAVEMLAAKIAGIKVRIAHSHNTKCEHEFLDKLLRPFFLKWNTHGFACSPEAGKWMFLEKKFEIISNGVDINRFRFNSAIRNQMRSQYKLQGKLIVGHIGRFSPQKNHKRLIEIFEEFSVKHSNAKLLLIGDGELKSEIEKEADTKKLDVFFVGQTDEVEKWLQAMDIAVFPSIFEGLPLGIVEAQASALPCVLSDTISTMTAVTDLVSFIDLQSSNERWVEVIEKKLKNYDRECHCLEVEMQIRQNHFDIFQNCANLQFLYRKMLSEVV